MARVALFSFKPILDPAGNLAGPAIRPFEMARALAARGHEVRLLEPESASAAAPELSAGAGVDLGRWHPGRSLSPFVRDADLAILPQELVGRFTDLGPVPRVIDLFDPHFVSCLFNQAPHFDAEQAFYYAGKIHDLARALREGDLFLCAGGRQRLFYLGMLQLLGRINPETIREIDRLIRIVPLAAPEGEPAAGPPLIRGVHCSDDAPIVLWSSGIYPYLDAEIVLDAFLRLRAELPAAQLLFVGADNPTAPEMREGYRALRSRVENESIQGIHFHPWQPYEERGRIYHEVDVAVALSPPHLETELCFRHRIVDLLWGGVPVVVAGGNDLGEWTAREGAARILGEFDAGALARLLSEILSDRDKRDAMSRSARAMAEGPLSWERIVGPVDEFCRDPRPAPDLAARHLGVSLRSVLRIPLTDYRGLLNRARISYHVRGGLAGMLLRRGRG
ncbi:MAG: hypothetical protein CME06_07505 [Gemmatimonadetes bacterium]|nr:hypothetical protein [Gemmatimonadota bacterium]